MIKVYDSTEKLFNNNGVKILHPLKAEIFIEDNGDYYIDIESSIQDLDYLQEGMIIRANTRWGEQGFRLTNPERKNNRITVRGYHLTKDSSRYTIVNSYVENRDCNFALDHLNSSCDQETPFTTISDITVINSIRVIRKTLEEAISDVITKWGGHLYRDNWTIGIKSSIGMDRGMVIKYGKNSKDIVAEENWDSVVTKLLPVGYDGITLPEIYLNNAISYEIPYTKIVKFDQDIDQENFKDEEGNLDEEAYNNALIEDLRYQANVYLNEHQYPECNYKVKAHINGIIDLGDTIVVQHEKLGININTNVISLKYDCIRDEYIEVEFGNFKSSLKDLVSKIQEATNQNIKSANETVTVTLEKELNDATSKIWGTLGNSYVIYEGDRILVVDSLPKETAKNVMMINASGIGFSNTGINGTFSSAWLIDGTLDMQTINVINMSANLIKGGTFKVGSKINEAGRIEIYDQDNNLIGTFDENGICIYGKNDNKVVISSTEFAGYANVNGEIIKVFAVNGDTTEVQKLRTKEMIAMQPIKIVQFNNPVNGGWAFVTDSGGNG